MTGYLGTPMYAIPNVSAPVQHAGLLNSPNLWTWLAYASILALAAWCMPPGLKDSLEQLWTPVRLWLAALHAPLAVGWWGWIVLCVLRPIWAFLGFVKSDEGTGGQISPMQTRAGFRGFLVPRKV